MGKTCMNATAAAGLSLSVVHNMIWLLYVILRWLQNVAHKNDISVEGGGVNLPGANIVGIICSSYIYPPVQSSLLFPL